MAKLIRILAASVGGGLALGAGIRLGERLVAPRPGESGARTDGGGEVENRLADRLEKLEGRLTHLEGAPVPTAGRIDLPAVASKIEAQAADIAAVRLGLEQGSKRLDALGRTDAELRAELRVWVDQRVEERLRGVEAKLRSESDEAQREMLNTVIESVQTRVVQRISRLEEELASQVSGMEELRECTLRTEHSMQKLLGGIDLLIAAQQASERRLAEVTAVESAAEVQAAGEATATAVAAESGAEVLSAAVPRARRWNIFG